MATLSRPNAITNRNVVNWTQKNIVSFDKVNNESLIQGMETTILTYDYSTYLTAEQTKVWVICNRLGMYVVI